MRKIIEARDSKETRDLSKETNAYLSSERASEILDAAYSARSLAIVLERIETKCPKTFRTKLHCEIAVVLSEAGFSEEAKSELARASEFGERAIRLNEYADRCNPKEEIFNALVGCRQFEDAKRKIEEAVKDKGNTHSTLCMYAKLSKCLAEEGLFEEALELIDTMPEDKEQGNWHRNECLAGLSLALLENGLNEKAREISLRIVGRYEYDGYRAKILSELACGNLEGAYKTGVLTYWQKRSTAIAPFLEFEIKSGQFEKAEETSRRCGKHFETMLQIVSELADKEPKEKCSEVINRIKTEFPIETISRFTDNRELTVKVVGYLTSLAIAESKISLASEAENTLEKAFQYLNSKGEKSKPRGDLGESFILLAAAYKTIGSLERAAEVLLDGLNKIRKSTDLDPAAKASDFKLFGVALSELGLEKESREALAEASQLYSKVENHRSVEWMSVAVEQQRAGFRVDAVETINRYVTLRERERENNRDNIFYAIPSIVRAMGPEKSILNNFTHGELSSVFDKIAALGRLDHLGTHIKSFVHLPGAVRVILENINKNNIPTEKRITLVRAVGEILTFELCEKDEVAILAKFLTKSLIAASEPGLSKKERAVGHMAAVLLASLDLELANDCLLKVARQHKQHPGDQSLLLLSMRCITELLDQDSKRAATEAIDIIANRELPINYRRFLIGDLIRNGFWNDDTLKWINENASTIDENPLDSPLKSIAEVVGGGLTPTRETMNFIVNTEWRIAGRNVGGITNRLMLHKERVKEFEESKNAAALMSIVTKNKQNSLSYYIAYQSGTSFDLISNYDVDDFRSVISLAKRKTLHFDPIKKFTETQPEDVREGVARNLQSLEHPHKDLEGYSTENTFAVNESKLNQLRSATLEIGNILGREQLGVLIKYPFYRERVSELDRQRMNEVSSLRERSELIDELERRYPELSKEILGLLEENWKVINGKLSVGVTLEDVFNNIDNPIDPYQLIDGIERSRLSIRYASDATLKSLLLQNREELALKKERSRLQKALRTLEEGYKISANDNLAERIGELRDKLSQVDGKLLSLRKESIKESEARLTVEQRDREIERLQSLLQALGEKHPAAIFCTMLMELIGEERINKDDIEIIKEVKSHLESPIDLVEAVRNRRNDSSQQKDLRVRLLDKRRDLLAYARFADAKICCFSSSQYRMVVDHGERNVNWVASILKDPMSFVFAIEEATNIGEARSNVGFVFGSLGVNSKNEAVLFINGVYNSSGNDVPLVVSVLNSIEEIFARPLQCKGLFLAAKHGGSTGDLTEAGFTKGHDEPVTRLRALKGAGTEVETRIYDDIGNSVNSEETYPELWYKKLD